MNPKVSLPRIVAAFALSIFATALFYALVGLDYKQTGLYVGSIMMPVPPTMGFYLIWQTFASVAALALTLGIYGIGERLGGKLEAGLGDAERSAEREKAFLILASLAGFAIPWLLRFVVLNDLPIADDESAYLFSARLLADFSLSVPSPPYKLFYDRAFLINDGRMFTQYFLGWPALLAPFTWIGTPEAANPLYSALTIPPLFFILKRFFGPRVAVAGIAAWLTSPFAMLLAATLMSHTTCTMGAVWGIHLALRSRDDDAPWWVIPAAFSAFCVAFWVRPLTGATIAAPWAIAMTWRALKDRPSKQTILATFGVVGILAGLFLAVNWSLTGSPTGTMYSEALRYARENGWRFSLWILGDPGIDTPDFRYDLNRYWLVGAAWLRLMQTALGWPLLGLLILIGSLKSELKLVATSMVVFMAALVLTHSPGIDTLGPVHVAELTPLALILAVGGISLLAKAAPEERSTTIAAIIALIITSIFLNWPSRAATVNTTTAASGVPFDAVAAIESDTPRVVFTPYPFVSPCTFQPSRSFIYWRPMNSPDLSDETLWLNHISVELDRKLMATEYPDRDAYVMHWTDDCRVMLYPLADPELEEIPTFIGPEFDVADLEAEFEKRATP